MKIIISKMMLSVLAASSFVSGVNAARPMLGKDYEPMEVLAQGQDVQHVSAAAIMSDGDGDEGNDVGDGAIVADGNLRGRVVVLLSKEEDTADGDVDNMNGTGDGDLSFIMESPSAIFEDVAEGGIGERAYKYRIKLDSGSGGTNSGTGNKIDIYVVNNDAYQTGGWYEDKLSYSSGIQYRSKKWTSDFWYCDEKKFDNSKTGYGLVICSNGGDGFFIDNMWLKKTCPTVGTWGCQTSETWSGNYCISTDSGDDFSGKCSQAYTCIHFRMNQSTVGPGTVRPTQQSSGSCSEKECQSTLGGQCGPWNPCCSGKKCNLSGKCYEERSLGQTCGAWKSCTNGLSCGNGKCYHNPRHFEEPCGSGAACGSGLSCAEGTCYHKPRQSLEPCGTLDPCADGLTCRLENGSLTKGRCFVPCASEQETRDIDDTSDELERKRDELTAAQEELDGAVTYYAAKLRGETSFIATELQAYYSETVEYCHDVDLDTSADYDDACNPANYEDDEFANGDDSICNSPRDTRLVERICNPDATRAEVIVHDQMVAINHLTEEIHALEEELETMIADAQNGGVFDAFCMAFFEAKEALIEAIETVVSSVATFVENAKCTIVKVLLIVMGKVVDKLSKVLPFVGPAITTMQAQPQCQMLNGGDPKKFVLPTPGGLVTGAMIGKGIGLLFCKLAKLDDGLIMFETLCVSVTILNMILGAIINGLCGKFGSAFVSIAEPFITCNTWDCGDNNARCVCPIKFDECSSNKGNFLDAMTMTSLPIATELDYGMVVAMAEQTEIFTGKDVANEANPVKLRGSSELQLQPSLENVGVLH